MVLINLRQEFGRQFKVKLEEAYAAQYGPHAHVDDPSYQVVPGRAGHIYAWDSRRLAASTNVSGSVATRLKALPGVEVWQDGDDGVTVLFPAELLPQVAALLKLRRRRQTSDKERSRLSELGRKYGFQPGSESNSRPRRRDSVNQMTESTSRRSHHHLAGKK